MISLLFGVLRFWEKKKKNRLESAFTLIWLVDWHFLPGTKKSSGLTHCWDLFGLVWGDPQVGRWCIDAWAVWIMNLSFQIFFDPRLWRSVLGWGSWLGWPWLVQARILLKSEIQRWRHHHYCTEPWTVHGDRLEDRGRSSSVLIAVGIEYDECYLGWKRLTRLSTSAKNANGILRPTESSAMMRYMTPSDET